MPRKKKRKKRVWRRMEYGDACQLVSDALEAFVEMHELESIVGSDPEYIDIALWSWARLFTWSWKSPARATALNLRTLGKDAWQGRGEE